VAAAPESVKHAPAERLSNRVGDEKWDGLGFEARVREDLGAQAEIRSRAGPGPTLSGAMIDTSALIIRPPARDERQLVRSIPRN